MDIKTLANLRKNSLENLNQKISKLNKPKEKTVDPRFWRLSFDKKDFKGTAVIRFLPAISEDSDPFVRIYKHSFQGDNGKWYIENCLSTLGQPDPAYQLTSKLWKAQEAGDAEAGILYDKVKRKQRYVSNILVIEDEAHPENEGKVFLYEYGWTVFKKIQEKMESKGRIKAFNPFSDLDGANLVLIQNRQGKFPNLDSSAFEAQSPLAETDEEILEILSKGYNLNEFIAPDQFKDYETLEKRLNEVLDLTPKVRNQKFDEQLPSKEAKTPKSQDISEDIDITDNIDSTYDDVDEFIKNL